MRADRARHAQNSQSLTRRRQERRLSLTRSHWLIVPLTKAPVRQTSGEQLGVRPGLHTFHWCRFTRSVYTDWVESEPSDRLRRNNCGGLGEERECARGAKQGKMKNKGNFRVNIIVMVCLSCGSAALTIHFPNFLQLAHKNKTFIIKTTFKKAELSSSESLELRYSEKKNTSFTTSANYQVSIS